MTLGQAVGYKQKQSVNSLINQFWFDVWMESNIVWPAHANVISRRIMRNYSVLTCVSYTDIALR